MFVIKAEYGPELPTEFLRAFRESGSAWTTAKKRAKRFNTVAHAYKDLERVRSEGQLCAPEIAEG